MNQDQIIGVIKAIAVPLFAYLVGKGWIPAGAVADLTALLLAIVSAIWSIYSNTTAHKMQASVNEMNAVQVARNIRPSFHVTAVANALKENSYAR